MDRPQLVEAFPENSAPRYLLRDRDSIYDEQAKQAYFSVIVETDRSFLKSGDKQLPITPGMICNVDIVTGRKSVLTYLLKPVLKAHEEALRER